MRDVLEDDSVASPFDFLTKKCDGNPCFPFVLASLYSMMGLATLIQLTRIHFLLHIDRWTMQKGFQLLNVLICICRAASLFAYDTLHDVASAGVTTLVIDFTSLLFFSTYMLLVLFWAEIVHLAVDLSWQCSPMTLFMVANVGSYVSAALFWSLCAEEETLEAGRRASGLLLVALDLLATVGFAYYGSRLLHLLKLSPRRSDVYRNKIREVSLVSAVCVGCFAGRALIEVLSVVKEDGLSYSRNGALDAVFYAFTEILTMGSVLVLLSRGPVAGASSPSHCRQPSEATSSRFYDPYSDYATESPMIPYQDLEV